MVDNGFAKKVVMEGTGAKAGESYAWAIANPDKVSVIYARNPLLRSLMAKTQPIDNLAPLAKAGVPILHDCGSLDPWLKDQTRVVEKRYKELGGKITVLVTRGRGSLPVVAQGSEAGCGFYLEPSAVAHKAGVNAIGTAGSSNFKSLSIAIALPSGGTSRGRPTDRRASPPTLRTP